MLERKQQLQHCIEIDNQEEYKIKKAFYIQNIWGKLEYLIN